MPDLDSAADRRAAAPPSGRQWELEGGGYRAVVVEVGGGLRRLDHGGRPLLDGYEPSAVVDGGRGQLLLPWPNRVADGRYRFDGRDHQLDLSEPALGHAIHGLARWSSWSPAPGTEDGDDERSGASSPAAGLTLQLRLQAQPSYPFTLDLEVAYQLGDDGLTTTVTTTNRGSTDAPVAAGAHPYLTVGAPTIDGCTLHVPADEVLTTDERLIPDGRRSVEGTEHDFRSPRPLGGIVLDTAYTGLHRDGDGRASVTLADPSGDSTVLWVDEHHPYVMVFTGDTLAPPRRRGGLAVEPMTAPPNALASGEDLTILAPGERWSVRWGVRAVPSAGRP